MSIGNILLYGLAAYGVYKIIDDKGVSLKDDDSSASLSGTRKRKSRKKK